MLTVCKNDSFAKIISLQKLKKKYCKASFQKMLNMNFRAIQSFLDVQELGKPGGFSEGFLNFTSYDRS